MKPFSGSTNWISRARRIPKGPPNGRVNEPVLCRGDVGIGPQNSFILRGSGFLGGYMMVTKNIALHIIKTGPCAKGWAWANGWQNDEGSAPTGKASIFAKTPCRCFLLSEIQWRSHQFAGAIETWWKSAGDIWGGKAWRIIPGRIQYVV